MHLSLTDPAAFEKERAWRRALDRHVQETAALAGISSNDLPLPTSSWDWECLRSLISTYERARGRLVGISMSHSFSLSFSHSFVHALARGITASATLPPLRRSAPTASTRTRFSPISPISLRSQPGISSIKSHH